MKLYLENSAGQELVIECDGWNVSDFGVLSLYKGSGQFACIREWNYVGEQPFDELLYEMRDYEKENGSYGDWAKSKGIVPPPPPPTTSNPNVDIERND